MTCMPRPGGPAALSAAAAVNFCPGGQARRAPPLCGPAGCVAGRGWLLQPKRSSLLPACATPPRAQTGGLSSSKLTTSSAAQFWSGCAHHPVKSSGAGTGVERVERRGRPRALHSAQDFVRARIRWRSCTEWPGRSSRFAQHSTARVQELLRAVVRWQWESAMAFVIRRESE